jgi:hypothetical protein
VEGVVSRTHGLARTALLTIPLVPCLLVSSASEARAQAPPSGPIAVWHADSSPAGAVGGNALTFTGTYTLGQFGKAFAFNGTNLAKGGAGLNVQSAFTVSAWVNFQGMAATNTTNNAPIVAKWGDTGLGTAGDGIFVFNGGVSATLASNDGVSVGSVSGGSLPSGQWKLLLAFYARTARSHGIQDGRTGTVTVIQRFGSGLQLNVHMHTLVLDGVFSEPRSGQLTFHPAPPPSDEDVAQVLATVRARVGRLLARRHLEPADDTAPADPLAEASPVLAGLVGASIQGRVALGPRAGARVRRLGDEPDLGHVTSRGPRQAQLDGFDLHANVRKALVLVFIEHQLSDLAGTP